MPSAEPVRLSTRDTAWPREKWAVYRWWYDRQMEAVDGCVDRLLDLLWNSRFRDDTVVIFTSDHGDNLGEHMLVHKQSLYEASVKVPMVLAWPGQWDAVGVDTEHLVSGLDVVPTVCELAGIAPPPLQRGRSLVPLMEGSGSGWRESVQVQSYVEGRALMRGDFKYITYRDDPKEFLFDVRQDPWELQDLAEDAAHASTSPTFGRSSRATRTPWSTRPCPSRAMTRWRRDEASCANARAVAWAWSWPARRSGLPLRPPHQRWRRRRGPGGPDCDDADAAVGAPQTVWLDEDADGYGNPAAQQQACGSRAGG